MDNRSRLRWRCRRGALELDILLERYLDKQYAQASAEEQAAFEQLLAFQDPELMGYLMGSRIPGDPAIAKLATKIRTAVAAGS